MNFLKYAAVIWLIIIVISVTTITYLSKDYTVKRTVITLPDADIQPVRSLGSHAGDKL